MTHLDTLCAQAGYDPASGEPRVMPVVHSTTYRYDTADELAALFNLEAEGHIYSRISNPTVAALEAKVAALEGGIGAVGTASGQSATLLTILALAGSGEHFVSRSTIYGGTHTLFTSTLARMGIEVTFVAPDATRAEITAAIRPTTRLLFGEVLANPGLEVADIEALAEVAHAHDLPLILDSTLATPILCRPFEYGCDVVIHSTTKYLDGHATSVGGLVVDSGSFAWKPERHSTLIDPDPAYHGLSWVETFGPAALLARIRAGLLRDTGAAMAPMNAFLTNLGVETLALRMRQTSDNGLAVARYLEQHPQVAWVRYPGLESSPERERAERYLPCGAGGMVTFGLTGGREAAKAFIDGVKLIALVTHTGDLRTGVLHPASTTHRQLSDDAQRAASIEPDLVRLSIGIEDERDLIADLDQAIAAAVGR